MVVFILGLVLFFGAHLVPSLAPGLRRSVIESRGEGVWKGAAALSALAGFVLIIVGWFLYRADAPELYVPPAWGRLYVTEWLVLIAFVLVFAAYMKPVGRIKATLQHPFAIGVSLWGLGHLFVNGDLASVLLFGAFLVYPIIYRISVATRGQPRVEFESMRGDIFAIVGGLVLYTVFYVWLHGWVTGYPLM